MDEYPKIETLYDRDKETFTVIPGAFRWPEFANVCTWLVTEKIDGTNVRVNFDGERVSFGGRTDRAQMPVPLLDMLMRTFTVERMRAALPDGGTLYGEGYGPKIQKGGGNYRPDPGFRLFDVKVGEWWLRWEDVKAVAHKLGIDTVPMLFDLRHDGLPRSESDLRADIRESIVARQENDLGGFEAEGIVARAYPELCDRRGRRLMWKLKFSDFREGRR